MSVNYLGPWGSTDIPVGQRTTGWSNHSTGAASFKTRYDDGDPAMSAVWRELYENTNYMYRQGRRHMWSDTWVGGTSGTTDPDKTLYTGSDWDDLESLVTVTPGLTLAKNVRGDATTPPVLYVKLRARRTGTSSCRARVYTAATLAQVTTDWESYSVDAPAGAYVEFSPATTYSADPGWLSEGLILEPAYSIQTISLPYGHEPYEPAPPTSAHILPDVAIWVTYMAIATLGDGAGGGVHVAAIQVREEVPS